ncbi:Cytochrome b5-like heme/steroid binding domain [Macleaya cordata]|uniref:Cytochrome b5-like heme/steroid binding domain n=1 Tax=Macleaya cordata TaxID=56857 RepID=A0A200QPZ2_MACCD|nr:Cytochrome b5-like heme/steroid binding domain [Macleaya cordata]
MVIIIATLILGVLLGAFLLFPRAQKPGNAEVVKSIPKEYKLYTRAEVSLHNKRTDCWVIIKDKVFDVTSYVEEHPGGDAILDHAGDDSTEGFYGPQHGTRVFDMIDDFYIGDLQH